jgi:prolipoprotein diacylglyceryltransferase
VGYPDGARYDLAVLEVFYIVLVMVLFLLLDRRPRPVGFYLGSFLLLYGPFRIVLDQLHVDVVRYWALSVDQWSGAAATLAGLGVWMYLYPLRHRSAAPRFVVSGETL